MVQQGELENELAAVLQEEIMKELAAEHNMTVEQFQHEVNEKTLKNLIKMAEWRKSVPPDDYGTYALRFTQRIPRYIDGVRPVVVLCNTYDEMFTHPIFEDFYKTFAEGFERFEVDDDGYVMAYYSDEKTPRWCCGTMG